MFDLEQFKQGRDAITRDGRRARFVYYDAALRIEQQVGAAVNGMVSTYFADGRVVIGCEQPNDLVAMAPKVRRVWARAWELDGEIGFATGDNNVDLSTNERPYRGKWLDAEPFMREYPIND